MKKTVASGNAAPRRMSMRWKNILTGYAFLLPWIIGFALITLYPMAYSLFLSFQRVKVGIQGIETARAGLYWYKEVLFSDAEFLEALGSTLRFVVYSLPVIVVVSLIIAVLLNNRYPCRGLFRTVFFFPVIIISGPVINEFIANNAATIGSPQSYMFYRLIARLPGPVSGPLTYVIQNIVLILWFSGVQTLIYLSGLQKIGRPIFEAAQIDGASQWEIFWKITLPYIKPYMLVNAIYTVVEMSTFTGTEVSKLIAAKMFSANVIYSYSAAISWLFFGIQILLLLLCYAVFRPRREKGV